MIEVRFLEHALAVADEGSFSLAAQALGISQSALSRSIQSLETLLDVTLFERSHRRIELTDAGQIFLDHARDLVMRHAQLSEEMGLIPLDQCPTFTLAAGPYAADFVAGRALAKIIDRHPEVQFRLRVESWVDTVKLVRSREADLGVADVSQLGEDPELEVTPLPLIQGYMVVRRDHPLLLLGHPSLPEILNFPLVSTARLPPRLLSPLQKQRSSLNGNGKSSFPAIFCEQVSAMRTVVKNSDGVGMFILPLIEEELRSGALVLLPCELPWLHTQFGIVRLRNRPASESCLTLMKLIEQASAELANLGVHLAALYKQSLAVSND